MTSEDTFANEANLALLTGEKGVAIALSSSGDRLIGGTSTGLAVFGVSPSSSLPAYLTEQIGRLSSQIGFSAPRLVRLRLGGLKPVTVRAQRTRLSDGTGVLVLAALDATAPRRAAPAEPVSTVTPAQPAPKTVEPERPVEAPVEPKQPAPLDAVQSPQLPFDPVEDEPAVIAAPAAATEELAVDEPVADEAEVATADVIEPEAVEIAIDEPADADVVADVAGNEPLVEEAAIAAPASEPLLPLTSVAAQPAAKRPLRFVWQADQDGLLTLLSPEFAKAVDADISRLLGRSWSDLALSIGFDPEGKLDRALGRRDTWSGVTIEWPLPESMFAPIDLAGLPVYDRERLFQGFRGFGVCREPQPRMIALAEPEPVASEEPIIVQDTAPDAVDASAESGASRPESVPADPLNQDQAAQTADQPVANSVVPFPDVKENGRPPLSNSERHAFREIARTLGSRAPAGKPATTTHLPLTHGRVTPRPQAAPSTNPQPQATAATTAALPGPQVASAGDEDSRLLDALPVAVLLHRGGVPIYANRALHDLTGYATLDALAREGVESLFNGTVEGNTSGVQLTRADGISLIVECHLKQVDWEGDPASLLTFRPIEKTARPAAVDTTAMTDAAQKIRELSAMLDTATDGVVVLDGEGRILSINRSAEALFGYESAELSGRSLTLLLSTESHNTALDYIDGLRAHGVAALLNDGREVLGIARRGGFIPLFMTVGRLGDDDGAKFCAVLRDITQFKKAEEELRVAKTHAETTSAQKSDFLARISHEIRTPLNAILGFAEVMIEERFGPVGTERYRDYLRDIHTSGQHVISLVNDLLDLSKIEAGRLDLSFTSLQLNDVVTTAVGLMQPQANSSMVIVRTSLAAKLPAVVADERSIRQIALNLLSNAIKFTPAGGQVIISTALTDLGQAVIRVRDTGIGMNEKDIQAALEPFRQIPTSGRGDGTGLGLPLTKALTEANRATFAIQSAAGSGTLVEVIFPPTRVLAE